MTTDQRLERIEKLLIDVVKILSMQLNEKMLGKDTHSRIQDELQKMWDEEHPKPALESNSDSTSAPGFHRDDMTHRQAQTSELYPERVVAP